MGQAGCPGREPDCLKPTGTWVGVSARVHNDSNSIGDRATEGRSSEDRHAGTGEGISTRIHHQCGEFTWGQGRGAIASTAQIHWGRGITPAS